MLMSSILYTKFSFRLENKEKENDIYQEPFKYKYRRSINLWYVDLPMCPFFQPPFLPLTPRRVTHGNTEVPGVPMLTKCGVRPRTPLPPFFTWLNILVSSTWLRFQYLKVAYLELISLLLCPLMQISLSNYLFCWHFWFVGQSLLLVHTILENRNCHMYLLAQWLTGSKQSLVSLVEICIYWLICCCHFSL